MNVPSDVGFPPAETGFASAPVAERVSASEPIVLIDCFVVGVGCCGGPTVAEYSGGLQQWRHHAAFAESRVGQGSVAQWATG